MSATSSSFWSPIRKAFQKPFGAINKKIGESTGKIESGGAVENPSPGPIPSVNFRQVGSVPDDQSGFPVQHLGDNK
jgi:hypothetical protein